MEKVLTTDVILIVQAMVNSINQCTPKSLTKLRNFKLCSWTRVSSAPKIIFPGVSRNSGHPGQSLSIQYCASTI